MRTQLEVNHYLQDTTIKNAQDLLNIELCINSNNLRLPNNVIIHENGINYAEFYKWFENRCFKEGDIIISSLGHIHLLMNSTTSYLHLDIIHNALGILNRTLTLGVRVDRYATEEEKQKLFAAIKAKGYKWNSETKTLEKLIKPKFKVGNIVQNKDCYKVKITEVNIEDECYGYESLIAHGIGGISFNEQNDWELVPNKFDITTLKPFDKVLVRCSELEIWRISFFENYNRKYSRYPFVCLNGNKYSQCIPYEGNKHLLGTSNDCNDFYKT